ncbi:glycosyltransferase family 4 protein [Cellulomonas sp. zg-ZUI222]|uniref:glycosyltransferase family 4 protein n=1 Tax=Cellulomonas TaxID=1707 RepID=UPI001A94FE43|nr:MULTISPECIES: glycosyltransferase family 4 protein [Cellulomonas]MBO0899867.1 glycosyltransferase family 4 protein [Cellulomonas sp. zg-ZUI22]MBO0921219.1 glycosyltransferase family 4 protein [Cellulomonas wangleii]
MSERRGRIGFVPARYGDKIVGGAEIVLRQMAFGLQERGWDVEVLTTTALDHHGWANELPAGVADEGGMRVRRFTVDPGGSPERAELEARILRGERLTITEQQRWMNGGMRSPELYHYLLDHADDYRALVFTPYPFWVTYACSQVAPSRSVLWTCLHDEPYAYLELFQPVFSGVAGLLFQSGPEQDLAERVAPSLAPHAVVGCGVEVPDHYDPEGFRERYGIEGPFLLYAGRREGGKGWDDLLAALARIDERRGLPFSVVTMGAGEVRPPERLRGRVIDVGFLPDDERDNAFAAATAYVQPSRFEAFSRTIMEAWLAGTPVIANAGSEVVAWHCERSGAGLTYDDEYELEQCLAFLADAPEQAAAMAVSGRAYVLDNYRWDLVLDRVEERIEQWTVAP